MADIDIVFDDILALKDNWNDNDAEAFEPDFVSRVRDLSKKLKKEPFVAPTACNSIQLEYENENGYLEFEIFEDCIYIFQCNNENSCVSEKLDTFDIEKLNEYISDLYS